MIGLDLVGLVALAHDHVFPDMTPVLRASLLIRILAASFFVSVIALAVAGLFSLPLARRQNRKDAEEVEEHAET